MKRIPNKVCFLAALALALTQIASPASAETIIYTSYSDLLTLVPAGADPSQFSVAVAEFTDITADDPLLLPDPSDIVGGYLETTGPISFGLPVGSGPANVFLLEYRDLYLGSAAPMVTMTLVDGSSTTIGPLTGGLFETHEPPEPNLLLFAFWSSDAFTRVSIELGSEVRFSTDVVGFYSVPTSVPEPSSLVLLGIGVAGLAALRKRPR